jgi:hypothetical protein
MIFILILTIFIHFNALMMSTLSIALIGRLALMAGPTQRFKVAVVVCAAVCLRFNMVNRRCCSNAAIPHAVLTQVLVPRQNARAAYVPSTAISPLLPGLALLMLLPSCMNMVRAVT